MGDSSREIVRRGYDAIGAGYHSWSSASPVRLRFVDEIMRRLEPGSCVVDLGCGPGDPATRLLSERHNVVGIDISAVQLELARRYAPKAILVQADLVDVTLAPESVDAVVSFYALGHLPAEEHAPLFQRLAGWLRPGGLLVTSAPLTPGNDVEDDWLGVPMFFGGIGAAATTTAMTESGLHVEQAAEVVEDEHERFLWVTATKPRAAT